MSTTPPTPMARHTSGYAVASLCVAIPSVLMMFAHQVQVGIIGAIVGLILGVVGLSNIRGDRSLNGTGMAVTGVILSSMILIFTVVFWVQVVTHVP